MGLSVSSEIWRPTSKNGGINMKTKNGSHSLALKILEILSKRPAKIGELERALNKSKSAVMSAIDLLKRKKHRIVHKPVSGMYFLEQAVRVKFTAIPKEVLYSGPTIRKLGMSETHFGGRHSQPHFIVALWAAIKSGEFGKTDLITHYGDVFNGLKHLDYSRGGNILNGVDTQIRLGTIVMSCFEGVPVYIRPGDHDMWQYTTAGVNMVANLVEKLNLMRKAEGKEPNFHYVSSDDNDQVETNGFIFEFKHIMSAQSRGLTTKAQYMFEDRMGDFVKALRDKGKLKNTAQPHHIGFGNWHREISFFHGGTAMDLYPGFQEPTDWEKNMGIVHKFGAKVITLGKDKNGNIFRYDVRYIDFTDIIEKITGNDLDDALLNLALRSFNEWKKKLGVKKQPRNAGLSV